MGRLLAALLSSVLVAGGLPAAAASAAPTLFIDGGGNGHGVGLSQYGAYGFALHGFDYRAILAHYYTGTTIGGKPSAKVIRVLVQSSRHSVGLSGATRGASRRLSGHQLYRASLAPGGRIALRGAGGRVVGRPARRLVLRGPASLKLRGTALNGRANGRYRGAFELRPGAHGGLDVIDVVALDDYVRGVVAAESISSWPLAELEAQAVASRTYALTAGSHATFDVYADTRSQQYGGIAAETARTDRAVALTAGQLVTYQGRPVVTFFFDTSGGRTENVENSFLGSNPEPWLVSVDDPYDALSPRHRFGPLRVSLATAQAQLGSLVQGSLVRIDVRKRGVSPRVVAADVVGSGGTTPVTGAQLKARLGLPDTWACFAVSPSGDLPPPGWDAACQVNAAPPGGAGGGTPSG